MHLDFQDQKVWTFLHHTLNEGLVFTSYHEYIYLPIYLVYNTLIQKYFSKPLIFEVLFRMDMER